MTVSWSGSVCPPAITRRLRELNQCPVTDISAR
jgi:hypothetical protein